MKKRLFSLLLCAVTLILLLPAVAYADMGPKPSVTVTLAGLGSEECYVTLLADETSTGPFSVSTAPVDESSYLVSEHKQEALAAWRAFRGYADADGFHFLEYFSRCSETQPFRWGYYPPRTFKVLLYFPARQSFVVTEVLRRYAFDSCYRVTVNADKSGAAVEKNEDAGAETISLLARIALTLAVELLIALPFGLRRKKLLLILAANVVTQVTLNLLLNWINYTSGSFAFIFHYIWMELLVTLIEAVVYARGFPRAGEPVPPKWVAPVYAVTANAASFGLGLLLARLLPGIF